MDGECCGSDGYCYGGSAQAKPGFLQINQACDYGRCFVGPIFPFILPIFIIPEPIEPKPLPTPKACENLGFSRIANAFGFCGSIRFIGSFCCPAGETLVCVTGLCCNSVVC